MSFTITARRRRLAQALAVPVMAGSLALAGTGTASANTGTDCKVSYGGSVYSSSTTNSATVGYLHTSEVWHHYYSEYTNGTRWSSGYIKGSTAYPSGVVRGFVPYARLYDCVSTA